jgi:hypothetical protein
MKARQQQQQQQQQQGGSPRIPAAGTRAIPGAVPVGHSTAVSVVSFLVQFSRCPGMLQ